MNSKDYKFFKDYYFKATKSVLLDDLKKFLVLKKDYQECVTFFLENGYEDEMKSCVGHVIYCQEIIDLINYSLSMYDNDLKNEDGSLNEYGLN